MFVIPICCGAVSSELVTLLKSETQWRAYIPRIWFKYLEALIVRTFRKTACKLSNNYSLLCKSMISFLENCFYLACQTHLKTKKYAKNPASGTITAPVGFIYSEDQVNIPNVKGFLWTSSGVKGYLTVHFWKFNLQKMFRMNLTFYTVYFSNSYKICQYGNLTIENQVPKNIHNEPK